MANTQTKVSDKYQVVIPRKIRQATGLTRGSILSWVVLSSNVIAARPVDVNGLSWAEKMRGLGAEIWQGEEAQNYINNLRDEWKDR